LLPKYVKLKSRGVGLCGQTARQEWQS